jgi:hypothetical protein
VGESQNPDYPVKKSIDRKGIIKELLPIFLLLSIYSILVISSTFRKAPVFDEPFHITGGYNYLKNGDLKMSAEGGFLTEAWLALPLLSQNLKFPYAGDNFFSGADEWETSRDFLFRSGNDADSMTLHSRIMVLLSSILLGITVYLISRSVFGPGGALISLFLFAFSPDFLAHGGLATTDMTSSFIFILAIWAIWRLVNRISPTTVIFSSVILGLLFVTKHSAIMIIPFYLVMITLRLFFGKPLQVNWFGRIFELKTQKAQVPPLIIAGLVNAAIIIFFIWAACGFRYSMLKDDSGQDRIALNQASQSYLDQSGTFGNLISTARDCKILPEAYLYGFAFFIKYGKSRYSFLDSEFSTQGWWYFFPFTFLYKTPLPLIFLLIISILALAKRRANFNNPTTFMTSERIYQLLPFISFIIIYMLFAMTSRTNIGHRHLLTVYLALFVISGSLSVPLSGGRKIVRVIILSLFAWLMTETLIAWPNYISYFNRIAGGSQNGYKHLVDSSLDWGQDLKELRKWADTNNQEKENVYFSFFGNTDVEYYGLKTKMLPSYRSQKSDEIFELKGGIYCISATMFQFLYLAESCYGETGFDVANADDKYLKSLSEDMKSLPKTSKKADLSTEQQKKFRIYEYLRFIKLCLFLHNREPDRIIGNSILVFKVSEEEIKKAFPD